jgi:hypothetical protein
VSHVQADYHVLERRHVPEETDVLKGPCYPTPRDRARLEADDGSVVEQDRAAVRTIYTGYAVEERRLAGAVGPDDRPDLPLLYAERDHGDSH